MFHDISHLVFLLRETKFQPPQQVMENLDKKWDLSAPTHWVASTSCDCQENLHPTKIKQRKRNVLAKFRYSVFA